MKVVYARVGKTWVAAPDGTRVWVHVGQHWPADDPIVRKYPRMFTEDPAAGLSFSSSPPAEDRAEAPVEQATAAPGEKRATRRARKPAEDRPEGDAGGE